MAEKLLPLTALEDIKTYCKNNYCSNFYQKLSRTLTFEYSGGAQCLLLKQTEDTNQLTVDFFHGSTQDAVLGVPQKGRQLSIWTGSKGWQVIQTGATNSLSAKQVAEIMGGAGIRSLISKVISLMKGGRRNG